MLWNIANAFEMVDDIHWLTKSQLCTSVRSIEYVRVCSYVGSQRDCHHNL